MVDSVAFLLHWCIGPKEKCEIRWCMFLWYMSMCMHLYGCAHVCKGLGLVDLECLPLCLVTFLSLCLSMNLKFTSWLEWLAGKLQHYSPLLPIPSAKIMGVLPSGFRQRWRSELRTSCICSRHFANWAIFQVTGIYMYFKMSAEYVQALFPLSIIHWRILYDGYIVIGWSMIVNIAI